MIRHKAEAAIYQYQCSIMKVKVPHAGDDNMPRRETNSSNVQATSYESCSLLCLHQCNVMRKSMLHHQYCSNFMLKQFCVNLGEAEANYTFHSAGVCLVATVHASPCIIILQLTFSVRLI